VKNARFQKGKNSMQYIRGSATILTSIAILLCGCDRKAPGAGQPPRSFHEQAGGFSYDPPKDWQIMDFAGMKYRISHGPAANGFAANINVVEEKFSGSLNKYVDLNLDSMKNLLPEMTILKREDFQTEDRAEAIRLITQNKQQGRMLRQTFYFFSNSSRKYVVTCTALADKGDGLDTAFADSMRTFRFD
jgi:hypothetical protein